MNINQTALDKATQEVLKAISLDYDVIGTSMLNITHKLTPQTTYQLGTSFPRLVQGPTELEIEMRIYVKPKESWGTKLNNMLSKQLPTDNK